MYPVFLFAHSWLRWAVLVLAVLVLTRSLQGMRHGRWTPADKRTGIFLVAALDTEVLLGLILYFGLSPMTPRSFADLGARMHDSTLRFFAVEHAFGMIVALVAMHVGWAMGRRAPSPVAQHRRVAIGVAIALLMLVASTPWPMMPYGRPLFRGL